MNKNSGIKAPKPALSIPWKRYLKHNSRNPFGSWLVWVSGVPVPCPMSSSGSLTQAGGAPLISLLRGSSSCHASSATAYVKTTLGEVSKNPAPEIGTWATRSGRTVWSHVLPLELGIFGQGDQGDGGCSSSPSVALGVLGQASTEWCEPCGPRAPDQSSPVSPYQSEGVRPSSVSPFIPD